jgi:hypothetical protein
MARSIRKTVLTGNYSRPFFAFDATDSRLERCGPDRREPSNIMGHGGNSRSSCPAACNQRARWHAVASKDHLARKSPARILITI